MKGGKIWGKRIKRRGAGVKKSTSGLMVVVGGEGVARTFYIYNMFFFI